MIWFCHKLSGANHKQWYTFLINTIVNNKIFMGHLVYLKNRNGKTNIHPIDKFKDNHKTHGNPFTNTCFVCRNYLQRNGKPSTTQHTGDASYLNYHCVQLIVQNIKQQGKYMFCLVGNLSTYGNINYFCWRSG